MLDIPIQPPATFARGLTPYGGHGAMNPRYIEGRENTCPVCYGRAWWIGKHSAECSHCETPLLILKNCEGNIMSKKLIPVKPLLGNAGLETVDHAADKAVEQIVTELDGDKPADLETAEVMHDTIDRLSGLSKAGELGKIS